VTIRRATEADRDAIRVLWEEFEAEVPPPPGDDETFDEDWVDTSADIRDGAVYLAEDDDGPLGYVRLSAPERGVINLNQAHVAPRGRRQGLLKELLTAALADVARDGVTHIRLDVVESNDIARAVWSRLGFRDVARSMAAPLDRFEQRISDRPEGEHRASTHAQTDDEQSVQRAVAGFIPRLESPQVTSSESWIRVSDPVLDRDHEAHARFARELSERLGAVTVALSIEGEVVRFRLYERGRMVDEYLSVPAYFGPLSRGDELALEANPTLVARLTGAEKDDVRRIARTAASPAELPPAADLYLQIANLMGVEP
jgi:ribosomal protein S18 acetylase RimI-like enzyme